MNDADISAGTRVRVLSAAAGLTLDADTGTVVGPVEQIDVSQDVVGFWRIALDKPAIQSNMLADDELLPEIVEYADNLAPIVDPPDAALPLRYARAKYGRCHHVVEYDESQRVRRGVKRSLCGADPVDWYPVVKNVIPSGAERGDLPWNMCGDCVKLARNRGVIA